MVNKYLHKSDGGLPWAGLPFAAGSGGTGVPNMRMHRARTVLVSAILATTALLISVATVLAEGYPAPIPR